MAIEHCINHERLMSTLYYLKDAEHQAATGYVP